MARRIFRRDNEGVRVRLRDYEADVFVHWLDDLRRIIDDPESLGPEVVRRLQPTAHPDDPLAEDDYQQLNAPFLEDERRAALAHMQTTIEQGRLGDGSIRAQITADDAEAWLISINYLRLAFGTALGIEADVDPDIAPNDPMFPILIAYAQLSYMLEELLDAMP